MNTCSFTTHFKEISVCSKVIWSLRLQLWWCSNNNNFTYRKMVWLHYYLISKLGTNNGKNTLGSWNPRNSGGTNFIAYGTNTVKYKTPLPCIGSNEIVQNYIQILNLVKEKILNIWKNTLIYKAKHIMLTKKMKNLRILGAGANNCLIFVLNMIKSHQIVVLLQIFVMVPSSLWWIQGI